MAGRPFMVGAEARVAETCTNSEWSEEISQIGAQNISQSLRHRVGQLWAKSGAMEHASVASFARHIMQLLSLGAPAELVEQTQQAIKDEIRHAKQCYGLASSYLDREVGPGRLNVTTAMDDESADNYEEAIVTSVIHEGAIGETLAAYKARLAAKLVCLHLVNELVSPFGVAIADHGLHHATECDARGLDVPTSHFAPTPPDAFNVLRESICLDQASKGVAALHGQLATAFELSELARQQSGLANAHTSFNC